MMAAAVGFALLLVAIGVQVLARYVQRFGTDLRPPGPLVELRRTHLPTLQPADFEQLEGLVADGLVSDAHLDRQLLPLLRELGSNAPGGAVAVERPSRRGRAAWLDETITRLEQAWGL